MEVCTIVPRRELARARVLAEAIARLMPGWRLTVLALSGAAAADLPQDVRSWGLDDVAAIDEWGLTGAANSTRAQAMAFLPALVRAMLDRSGDRPVLYLGAGLTVLGSLDALEHAVELHQTVLVARSHGPQLALEPFPCDPAWGAFSREALAFRKGPASDLLLAAWPRRFADGGDSGATASRGWLDSIPALSEDVGIVRDPGYGLDPMTLAGFASSVCGGMLELEGGCPARLIDLSGLDPLDPSRCFAGDGRAELSTRPGLAAIVRRYASDLLEAGHERFASGPDVLERLRDGARLTPTIRGLIVEAISEGALRRSPYTDAGRTELYEYLNAPSDRGRTSGLTRLHMAIWHSRRDLREAYPHLAGPDGEGYAGWLCEYGCDQEGLVAALLPPAPDIVFPEADSHRHVLEARWGVNVAGFFTAELGVGEAARLLMAGLDAAGIPALPIQGKLEPPSRQRAEHRFARPGEAAFPINIVCINGDGIPVFAREAGRSFFVGRHTIALWWWEVGEPPADWRAAYEFVDEVWVASEYIYERLAPSCPVPVVKVTLPVLEPPVAAVGREQLGLPEAAFLFLYIHDYHSVAARKNPEGAIEAFRRAFAPGNGAKLVVKSINAATRPAEHERVSLAAAGHPDVLLIDGYLSAAEKNAMLAHCDCYVSLHRSEGFGLTVAEALLLERPVIATAFGGTQDFLDEASAYLVGWSPVRVGEGAWPYPPDGVWAEPDLEQASKLMRLVVERPEQARSRALRGRSHILEHHSPAVAGASMERRLRHLRELLEGRGVHATELTQLPALPEPVSLNGCTPVADLLGRVPQVALGNDHLGEARRKVMRPLLDWAREYADHQQLVARELEAELLRLDDTQRRLEERIDEVARNLQEGQQELRAQILAFLRRLES